MKVYPLISRKLDDIFIPGVVVEVDPEEADDLGFFEEPALTAKDALEASFDGGEDE